MHDLDISGVQKALDNFGADNEEIDELGTYPRSMMLLA